MFRRRAAVPSRHRCRHIAARRRRCSRLSLRAHNTRDNIGSAGASSARATHTAIVIVTVVSLHTALPPSPSPLALSARKLSVSARARAVAHTRSRTAAHTLARRRERTLARRRAHARVPSVPPHTRSRRGAPPAFGARHAVAMLALGVLCVIASAFWLMTPVFVDAALEV